MMQGLKSPELLFRERSGLCIYEVFRLLPVFEYFSGRGLFSRSIRTVWIPRYSRMVPRYTARYNSGGQLKSVLQATLATKEG